MRNPSVAWWIAGQRKLQHQKKQQKDGFPIKNVGNDGKGVGMMERERG